MEFLSLILDGLPALIYWKDRSGKYLGCNKAFARHVSLESSDSILGKKDSQLYDFETAQQVSEFDQSSLVSQSPQTLEEIKHTNSGDVFYLTQKIPLFLEGETSPSMLLSCSIDITQYKQNEQTLRKKRDQLDKLIAILPDHIYWTDKQNVYLGCNDGQAKNANLITRKAIIGKTNFDLPWKKQAKAIERMNNEAMRTGKAIEKEEQGMVNGLLQTRLSKKVPIYGDTGDVEGVLGISIDITERKKMEEQLKIAKEQAEIANLAKTTFITNMSHDIRTPLVGILDLSERLYQQSNDEQLKPMLHDLQQANHALLDLFNSIIELAEIESGQKAIESVTFNVNDTIEEIAQLMRPSTQQKGLALNVELDSKLPEFVVSDKIRIRRIILNLVGNAIKFTKKGSVTIVTTVQKQNARSIMLNLSVKDTGIGIPKDKQEAVFSRFTRLQDIHDDQYKGTGLGLSIVSDFVKDLKGSISVTSEENKGSTFTCVLPLKKVPKKQIDAIKKAEKLRKANLKKISAEIREAPSLHALLIEDNMLALEAAKSKLESFNFSVDTAKTAKDGMKLFSKKHYDIIFSDLGLPEKDGYWLAQTIRHLEEIEQRQETPIMLLSAQINKDIRKKCLALGINDTLTKPLREENLLKAMNTFFFHYNQKLIKRANAKKTDIKPNNMLVVDLEKTAQILGSDLEAAKRITQQFIEPLPNEKKQIDNAIKTRNWKKLSHLIHNLEGALQYCCVPRLHTAIKKLQKAIHAKDIKKLNTVYQNVCSEIELLINYFEQD